MDFAPIIVFAYNRPHYLKETLAALSRNLEAAGSDLYIYCDGPKANSDQKDLALINQVRQLAHEVQWCKNVYVKEFETNRGLSRSVIAGVSEVVNKYGTVIVLEDDIVVAPFFLKYMNDALNIYKNEDKVASISGHNFPVSEAINDRETFFLKSITSWGWATWQRAWQLYDDDAVKLLLLVKKSRREKEFNFNNTYRYTKMLKNTIDGKVDSWAIRWYTSCFLQNKVTFFPTHSMVKNIGMVGTHIVGNFGDFTGTEYFEGEIKVFESSIVENKEIREIWQDHFKRHDRRKFTYKNLLYAITKFKTGKKN